MWLLDDCMSTQLTASRIITNEQGYKCRNHLSRLLEASTAPWSLMTLARNARAASVSPASAPPISASSTCSTPCCWLKHCAICCLHAVGEAIWERQAAILRCLERPCVLSSVGLALPMFDSAALLPVNM